MASILLNQSSKVKGFTIAPNKLLNANNISLKAKALYLYMSSKPDRWNFSATRIANELKEGVKGIENTLTELEMFNLLRRKKIKDHKGSWNGVIYYLNSVDDSNVVVEYHSNKKNKLSGRTVEQRKEEFKNRCKKVYETKKPRMTDAMIKAFFIYWTEITYGGDRMRFELQTAFDLGRRMETWIRNNSTFNPKPYRQQAKKELQTLNT